MKKIGKSSSEKTILLPFRQQETHTALYLLLQFITKRAHLGVHTFSNMYRFVAGLRQGKGGAPGDFQ